MKIYIEDSVTPIYNRISQALGRALVMLGHEVMLIRRAGFDARTYADFVASLPESSVYIGGNEGYLINARIPGRETYYFEQFPGKVIFLRHDAILGGETLLDAIAKLRAWKRVAARSVHLCLEPNNVADLQALGMSARVVPHVSEVTRTEPSADNFEFDASFVGHVIPVGYFPAAVTPKAQAICDQAVQMRRQSLDAPLEDMLRGHAALLEGLGPADENHLLRVATTQWFRNQVIHHTLPVRGWLLENAGLASLDIFGGDPAYIHRLERNLTLDKPGIRTHAAVYDTERLKQIFNGSRVTLNITSLQFDHCVVNRFHDATMAGSLCLTDRRPGLAELTSAHAEISFNTVEELGERVRYFTDPGRQSERVDLIRQIQDDVMRNTGYDKLALTMQDCLVTL